MKNYKAIIKIIVPVAIVAVIIGIWAVKNMDKRDVNKDKGDSNIESPIDNLDFALESTELDLDKLKSYGLPIMIDFGAEDCPPCQEMEPIIKELHEEYQGKVIIKFYDVWKDQSLAQGFPVQVIPTQFFFDKNGNPYQPSDSESMIMYTLKTTGEHIYTAHEGYMAKEMILEVFHAMEVE